MDFVYGVGLILLIVISSGAAVDVFEKLAHEVKVNKLLLATILVGFSTSLPELFVGLASAFKAEPQIALGNLIGANIANLSWIIGGAAVIAGTIPVVGDYLAKDLWVTLGAAMMPFLLMMDGKLSRIDGIILILIYLVYVQDMVMSGRSHLKHIKHVHHRLRTEVHWLFRGIQLLLSLSVLGVSASMLVNLAVKISNDLGVTVFWVGLIVIALGTTLPELILSLMASKRRDTALILGNVLGSVVVNSTLILGIIGVVSPIAYPETVERGTTGIFLITILGFFWLFTKSKHKLQRWEGLVLIGVYAMFIGIQLLIA